MVVMIIYVSEASRVSEGGRRSARKNNDRAGLLRRRLRHMAQSPWIASCK